MEISIIICTYNRCHNLSVCIDHIAALQGVEELQWEVVVVDNNSTDNTLQTVKHLQEFHSIPIRYIFERNQGLSYARNRGILETKSRYLIFIDDDICVESKWLKAIYQAFLNKECDAVGGRIFVDSPCPLPAWISPDMYGFLGHRDFGEQPFIMDGISQFPFGGNMAVSRRIIEKNGLFDTRMGRKGEGRSSKELFKGEETDYFHRMTKTGGKIYYEPQATVFHKILPHQLKKKFFRTIHFTAGYQKAMLDIVNYNRTMYGVPFFIFRQTVNASGKFIFQLITKGPNYAFRQQMTVGYFLGMMLGYFNKKTKYEHRSEMS